MDDENDSNCGRYFHFLEAGRRSCAFSKPQRRERHYNLHDSLGKLVGSNRTQRSDSVLLIGAKVILIVTTESVVKVAVVVAVAAVVVIEVAVAVAVAVMVSMQWEKQ